MMEKGSGSVTLLGAGASFEGKITTPHTIQIYGKFSGEIHTSDTLAIGRDGVVLAEVTAKSAQIGGKIQGNIICKECIEMEERADVRGNITAKELVIKKGAIFHGTSSMLQDPSISAIKKGEIRRDLQTETTEKSVSP
jgi:cytoskeletal protein CcmA (bactofilin family)